MKKLMQRPNFITFFTINLLFTTTVTWDMIKCLDVLRSSWVNNNFTVMLCISNSKTLSRETCIEHQGYNDRQC